MTEFCALGFPTTGVLTPVVGKPKGKKGFHRSFEPTFVLLRGKLHKIMFEIVKSLIFFSKLYGHTRDYPGGLLRPASPVLEIL